MTKPSRSLSNGREACLGSSLRVLMAFMAQKPPILIGTIVAADAGTEENADFVAIEFIEVHARILDGLPPGIDGKLGEPIRATHFLGRGKGGRGIEVLDLRGNLSVVILRVKRGDFVHPTVAL